MAEAGAMIGPGHPLVESGAITLTRAGGGQGKDEDEEKNAGPYGYPASWGVPRHPATHGAPPSSSSAGGPSDNSSSVDDDAGGGYGRPAGRARAHAALVAAAERRRRKEEEEEEEEEKKKKKKKKRRRRLTRTEKAERLTREDARARLTRSMSMGKVRWIGAAHAINTVSHLVRSSSLGGPAGAADAEAATAAAAAAAGETTALSELAPCPSPAWIRGVPHRSGLVESRTAWNPSPGSHHIQEIDDSSTTFAMAELKDEVRKRHIKHERRARKRRAKLKRKKELKRKLRGHTLAVQSIFRLDKGKDAALRDDDDDGDGLNKSVLGLIGGRVVRLLDGNKDAPSKAAATTTGGGDTTTNAGARQDDDAGGQDVWRGDGEGTREETAATSTEGGGGVLSSEGEQAHAEQADGDPVAAAALAPITAAGPADPKTAKPAPTKRGFSFSALTKQKDKGPTEEEIEAAKRARIDAFKREQAEKVRKEMQRRETQWQKDWENMYQSRQKDVLPDGSPKKTSGAVGESKDDALAQSAAVRRQKKEERRKKARAKRDKEIMREQRRRIRRREKQKIEAQMKLARLHTEHARWVESEMKKDADLVSGKHLGVEEMLFVVQARNSEACHPAFSGYNITDDVSRAPCPVAIMHPAFHGYTLVPRTRDWETEAEQEEIQWDREQKRKAKLAKVAGKRQSNLDAILASRDAEDEGAGSRKQRREAAKEKKERKEARAKEKKQKAQKAQDEAKEAALLVGVTDPLASAHHGHPAFWIAPRDKTQRPKQLKALAKMGEEEVVTVAAAAAAAAAATPGVASSLIVDATSPGAIVKSTILHTHPAHVHRPSMDEAFAEARLAARVAKKNADRQAAYDGRQERFLARVRHQDKEMHPSWRGMWRKYRLSQNPISRARALPDPHTSNPAFFQRLPVPLIKIDPEPEPEPTYEPPLRWGRPARCPVCQAPPGVQGRPGCPACYRTKARLPWTFPSRDLPEVYPPPFERDHGVVRLRAKRKKSKAEREARRKKKAAARNGGVENDVISAQPSLAGGGSTLSLLGSPGGGGGGVLAGGDGGTSSFLRSPVGGGSSILSPAKTPGRRSPGARELAARARRLLEKKDDMNAAAGMKRAALLANSHTPMIDRKALLQHRKLGGIAFVTVWVKTIPGGTCVKLIIDKHETVERIRFLFLANSGEYGPESWGYMVLPTDLGCFFLDQRCRYPTELRNGYLPGDRDLTDYGVGNKGSGVPEVVILMVSAGGGRTELNHRTMSEMLRRYFFQNANVEHDEKGRPMHLPVNIIERVMKPRWGKDGAPVTFPAADNAQKQLRRMCKNQLRIKRQAWEADMEVLRLADLHQRQAAYREHLRRTLRAKLEGYRKAQAELKHQHHMLRHEGDSHGKTDAELKISEETVDAALMLLEDHGSEAMAKMSHMTTGEILKQGRKSAKRRRLQNRIAVMKQKEKRFLRDSQARTLAGFNDIPMYVFRKWKPPPVPPPPPPPPPRRPGILTRFATFVYRGMLKPIGNGVVAKYRAIKNMRDALKEAVEADEFESSSDEEDNKFGDEEDDEDSGDELPVDAPLDIFGESGGE